MSEVNCIQNGSCIGSRQPKTTKSSGSESQLPQLPYPRASCQYSELHEPFVHTLGCGISIPNGRHAPIHSVQLILSSLAAHNWKMRGKLMPLCWCPWVIPRRKHEWYQNDEYPAMWMGIETVMWYLLPLWSFASCLLTVESNVVCRFSDETAKISTINREFILRVWS